MVLQLRSLIFILTLSLSLVVVGPLVALAYPLPFAVAHRMSEIWCRFFVWSLARIVGVKHRVRGLERLPVAPCVFFSKHQSAWETLAFETFLPAYVWIIKREALWIPFFGWGLAGLKPIAINRGARGRAVRQIATQGLARLQQGLSVMIFPEGTRVPAGQTRRFGLGGAVLACESGASVVPIAHNAGSFWPGRRLSLCREGVIDVVIGEPIATAGLSPEQVNAQAKAWIDRTVAELEGPYLARDTAPQGQPGDQHTGTV